MIKVVGVECLGAQKLSVRFSDGSVGEHDFATMLKEPGSMLAPLCDPAYFARVFLDFGALAWPNGFDIAPEWLRREMAAAAPVDNAPVGRPLRAKRNLPLPSPPSGRSCAAAGIRATSIMAT